MNILRRRYIEGELAPTQAGMKGRFRLLAYAPDGRLRRDSGFFDNLILDAGLNRWGSSFIINGAAIGSGTSTPLANQTQLDAQIAYSTSLQDESGAAQATAPYFYTLTLKYRFAFGANTIIREVGVGWASNQMFSRALIQDPGGTPIDWTMLAGETLDVVYQLRMYPPTADFTGNFTISGTNYAVVGRVIRADQAIAITSSGNNGISIRKDVAVDCTLNRAAFDGSIGPINGSPSGTIVNCGTSTAAAYVNNSLQRTATLSAGLADGNLAGGLGVVTMFWAGTNIGYQYGFTPKLSKDSTKTMTLGFTHSWARRP